MVKLSGRIGGCLERLTIRIEKLDQTIDGTSERTCAILKQG